MNNFELMRRRLIAQGGVAQEDRMIRDKYKTFLRTLDYSYQAAKVELVQKSSDCLHYGTNFSIEPKEVKALINPDKNKQDYDDKELSIDTSHGFDVGDVFRWTGTDTYWIIYLEELTEDAYFRGAIRRCKYKINFKDSEGNWLSTWAAIRGPVETQIESIQKNQIRLDKPNLSLNILLPRNEKTLSAFDRYDEFLFSGLSWRVQAPDTISMRNVINFAAEETYIDREKDAIRDEMKNGLVIEPIDPTPDSGIKGATFIKPKIEEIYRVDDPDGEWSIVEKVPVKLSINKDHTALKVYWDKSTHGQFTLLWHKNHVTFRKVIVVESLF